MEVNLFIFNFNIMKLLAGKILLFIGLFILSDVLLGLLVGNLHLNTDNINLQNANYGFLDYEKKDVLFIGASEVSHTFISDKLTEETGLSSYNLASDGCGIFYQYALLKTILDKQAPKIIVISSDLLHDHGTDYLTRIYPYYKENDKVQEVVDYLYPREKFKLMLNGYTYNSQIIRIFDGRSKNQNGYVPLTPKTKLISNTKPTELPEGENYHISEETTAYFKKFISLANENGIKVYVYVPPYLEKRNSEYDSKVSAILKETKAKVMDYSKDIDLLNKRHLFNDKLHLNHNGAIIIMDRFIDTLKQDKIID